MILEILQLPHGQGLPLPSYATSGSAGLDLMAAVTEIVTLAPQGLALIPTGVALALPPGYEAQVRGRSGLALKHQVIVLNSPGTIDSDYRGEIGVMLKNLSTEPFQIARGQRIAQMVIAPYMHVSFQGVTALTETPRASGGFGSTGV